MPNFDWRLAMLILFASITFIQVLYYWIFFARLAFFKKREKKQTQQHPVSVVVCSRDEAENLARNLPGILLQDYKTTFETVVVNDNSFDDSKYILEELKSTFRSLKVIELTQEAKLISGKKYPLSIGIREARHEVLLLTDADCVPVSDKWVALMQDGYDAQTDIVLGYSPYYKKPGFLNKVIRFETFHTALQYLSYALAGQPYMGVGRNLSYKKNLFLTNKGFSSINHLPSGDDDLFINKIANSHNTSIVIDKESFVHSQPKTSWSDWVKQKKRHYTTAKFYKRKHKFLLGLYSFSHFMFFPAMAAAFVFYDWRWVTGILGIRFLTQAIILFKTTKKLGEFDLWGLFWFFDIWLFFQNLFFLPSLFKRPAKSWK